jgi:hypothetical protein
MQGISHTMARVGAAVIFVAAWACTASAPQPAMLRDARTPLQRMADSTERLVGSAAQMSDSAVVWVGLATTDTVLADLRARLLTTREAVDRVSSRLAEAAQQGSGTTGRQGAARDHRTDSRQPSGRRLRALLAAWTRKAHPRARVLGGSCRVSRLGAWLPTGCVCHITRATAAHTSQFRVGSGTRSGESRSRRNAIRVLMMTRYARRFRSETARLVQCAAVGQPHASLCSKIADAPRTTL